MKPAPTLGRVELAPIGKVQPCPDNPRVISPRAVELVAASISEFGWQQPIVVDADYVILAGHTRYQAACVLELEEIPVAVAEDLTPEESKAYRIADNRTADYTSWDFDKLVPQLEELLSYSQVLALDDWEAPMRELEDGFLADLDYEGNADELADAFLGAEYEVSVVCLNETVAAALELRLAMREGVLDVRHKR